MDTSGRRKKDENGVSSRSQVSNYHPLSDTMVQRQGKVFQENVHRERNYPKYTQIYPNQESLIVHSKSEPQHDDLPFDRFWTIEEFLTQIQTTDSYETENGLLTEVVKCDRTGGSILLLYRDPDEVRTYCRYHLAIINVSNGNLLRNIVADYTNRSAALNSYYMRLSVMKANPYMKRPEENSDNELPF